jgi:hypothetical protein
VDALPGPDPADLFVPADPADVVVPRHGSRTLAEVVPAVVARLTGRPQDDPLGLALAGDRVVVLVVDGLGSRQLARRPGVAPLLSGLPGDDIDAAFPTTTVTSLASLGTGSPASQHGLVGYAFALPDHSQPLAPLGWRVGLRGGGFDARTVVVPEALVPDPTAFERAYAAGVATTVVLDPDFPDSGLSRAVLRGGERRTGRGLRDVLGLAVDAVTSADGPAVAYAHHPLVDWAGHTDGACSEAWCDAVHDVDRVLREVRAGLGPDVTVLVTADHGMVDVPEPDVVELRDLPGLLDGVRVLAGEPRVRQLALEPDADVEEVAARWRTALGERALVVPRSTALPWFGPDPSPTAVAHIGELVVVARRGSMVHADVDPHGGRHLGQHGGPSRAERLVPLRHLTADRR